MQKREWEKKYENREAQLKKHYEDLLAKELKVMNAQ